MSIYGNTPDYSQKASWNVPGDTARMSAYIRFIQLHLSGFNEGSDYATLDN